ncbi:RadC family protein [Tropicimonas marinistellae]|uniref:RadC family protein n=1 Tax=Tropicimonas marinistellae TaxID=1739787 RepID=UPI00098F221A|nr:DNA repair protein RadC [Tropicimonas marinistellae]
MSKIWDRIAGIGAKRPEAGAGQGGLFRNDVPPDAPGGFSEAALKGLDELEARLPPPGAETRPASQPSYRQTARLKADAAAGGGLVRGEDGQARPHYWGHRERLRQRFLSGGHAAMPEYELLEMLLFNAIPRIDTKPLAKRLLAAFGDLNGVIAAPQARLLEVDGATEKVYYQLRLAEAFAHRMARARVMQRHVLSSWDALMEYCKTVMAHRDTEQFRVLYLDRKNNLVADEAQAEGTVDHVPVYPREIVKRALELNASAVILVHNHPSGDPSPSNEDIVMTDRIADACQAVGITIHDHVVIGKAENASFRQLGYLG